MDDHRRRSVGLLDGPVAPPPPQQQREILKQQLIQDSQKIQSSMAARMSKSGSKYSFVEWVKEGKNAPSPSGDGGSQGQTSGVELPIENEAKYEGQSVNQKPKQELPMDNLFNFQPQFLDTAGQDPKEDWSVSLDQEAAALRRPEHEQQLPGNVSAARQGPDHNIHHGLLEQRAAGYGLGLMSPLRGNGPEFMMSPLHGRLEPLDGYYPLREKQRPRQPGQAVELQHGLDNRAGNPYGSELLTPPRSRHSISYIPEDHGREHDHDPTPRLSNIEERTAFAARTTAQAVAARKRVIYKPSADGGLDVNCATCTRWLAAVTPGPGGKKLDETMISLSVAACPVCYPVTLQVETKKKGGFFSGIRKIFGRKKKPVVEVARQESGKIVKIPEGPGCFMMG